MHSEGRSGRFGWQWLLAPRGARLQGIEASVPGGGYQTAARTGGCRRAQDEMGTDNGHHRERAGIYM